MSTQTETINIVVREDGSRVVSRNIADIGKSANAAEKALGLLKGALGAAIGGTVVHQVYELLNSFQEMQNKLKLTTTSQQNLNAVWEELNNISTRTRSSIETNVDLFQRLAMSTKDLGLSQRQILDFTEQLNQAIKISGVSSQEAANGIRQLTQGLSAGRLQGQDLRAVLEDIPYVGNVIAQGLGVTRGELRQLGTDGKITAQQIVDAFNKMSGSLKEEFGKTTPTLADGFTLLKNQVLETIGAIDQASGSSSLIGQGLADLATTLKNLTPELVNFARALSGSLDPMDEVSDAGKVFATIFVTLYGVLKVVANFISGVFVTAFKTAGGIVGGVSAAIVAALHGDFAEAGHILQDTFKDIGTNITEGLTKTQDDMIAGASQSVETLVKIWDKGARDVQDRQKLAIGGIDNTPGVAKTPGPDPKDVAKQQRELEKLRNQLTSVLNDIAPLAGAQLEMAKAEDTLSKAREKGLITADQETQYLELLRQHYVDILDPLGKLNREIDEQIGLLGLSARAREVEANVLSASKQLKEQGVILTQQETQALREHFEALQNLNEMVQIQDGLLQNSVEQRRNFAQQIQAITTLLNDPASGFTKTDATNALAQANPDLFEGTQEQLDAQLAQLQIYYDQIQQMRDADLISERTAKQMQAKIDAQYAELRLATTKAFFGSLATLSRSENSKLAKIGQAAALVQATIDAASAVMKTYAQYPYPYNIALAAAQAAASAVQISQIAGANTAFATGGEFTVGGSGGTDSQMVAFRATPGEKVAVSTPSQVRKGDPNGFNGGSGDTPVQVAGPTIINVRDPKEIPNAIQSSDGKNAIINVLSENAAQIRQVLQLN